ncbi:MAG TPA: hypothetical protein VL326_15405 [Kofleriaceae bacterium]|jgi:hypothetical protein|nr:hypothetical protein [Kofleriaceae bacterium]
MRVAVVLVVALAACTPDVFSESYYCGPDSSCPDGQACDGKAPDLMGGRGSICVLESRAQPFECGAVTMTEPDDTSATAHLFQPADCQGIPVSEKNCMQDGDAEDWVRFEQNCGGAAEIKATVSFPIAFERMAIELWDVDANTKLGDDGECRETAEVGEEKRCITLPVTAGTSYGVRVRPAGDGNCDGNCAHNRYSLSLQLTKP